MTLSTPTPSRRTLLVPTHVRMPEILITLAGINLSVRQFLLILVGAALSYRLFLALGSLAALPAGQIMRDVITALPMCVALAFAFVQLAARSMEDWCLAILRYALRPRQFIWRSVRFYDPGFGENENEEKAYGKIRP